MKRQSIFVKLYIIEDILNKQYFNFHESFEYGSFKNVPANESVTGKINTHLMSPK